MTCIVGIIDRVNNCVVIGGDYAAWHETNIKCKKEITYEHEIEEFEYDGDYCDKRVMDVIKIKDKYYLELK